MTAAALLSRLEGVRKTGADRWVARCPAHEDRRPSLSIRELADGRVLLHDFSGRCSTADVVMAVGLDLADLFPPRADDDKRAPRERRPFAAADAVRLIDAEIDEAVRLILVTAGGATLGAGQRRRLAECAHTVRQARLACGLPEVG